MIYLKVPAADNDVLDMVKDIFDKADKKIGKLRAHFINRDDKLDRNYFSQLTKDNAKPNRIHRLFHPLLVERLYAIYKDPKKTSTKNGIATQYAVPFLRAWNGLFVAMQHYYDDVTTSDCAFAAFQRMAHESRIYILDEGEDQKKHPSAHLPDFNLAAYTQCYEEFCKQFEKLPSEYISLTNRLIGGNGGPAASFAPVFMSAYAKSIIDICDQRQGVVSIIGVAAFYVSPRNTTAWEIIRQLARGEFQDDGYVRIKWPVGTRWQSAFSGNAAKPPANSNYKTAKELYAYIHPFPRQRSGYFRFETVPK